MAELKLRRLQELVSRLREDLDRRRIPVSEASVECVHGMLYSVVSTDNANSLINYTKKEPKDWMVPSVWGYVRFTFL